MAIAIEIGDTNAESRSKLRVARQQSGFEAIAPIQENHRGQRVGLDFMGGCFMTAENLVHGCLAESFVSRKSSEHIGQSFVAGYDVHDLRPCSSLGSRFAADIDGDCVDRPAFDIHFHAAQTDVRRLMIAAARRTPRAP